jgi:hypothetical protein
MLKMWRRLMTVKLLAVSAVSLAVIVAFVAIGFWHRRQLQADLKGHREHHLGHDARPFTVRGERAEQDAFRGEASPTAMASSLVGHGLINEDSAPGLRGLP